MRSVFGPGQSVGFGLPTGSLSLSKFLLVFSGLLMPPQLFAQTAETAPGQVPVRRYDDANGTAKTKLKRARKAEPVESVAHPSGPTLSLGDFLNQVAEKHDGYKATEKSSQGARLYSHDGLLLFKPTVTANASIASDGISDPIDAGSLLHYSTVTAGINEQTDFGLNAKLTFNEIDMEVPGFGSYGSRWLQVDLTQSLWRNWNGRELRAQASAQDDGSRAKMYTQSYMSKQTMIDAETNYWQLALAREVVKINQDAVDRARKINDWSARRVRVNLVDRAEALQSSTNLQAQLVNLRQSQDDEAAAAQAFNSSRGVDSNQVSESLAELAPELIAQMNAPTRTATRDDVKAAEFQARANAANAALSTEKDKPTLELYASLPVTQPTGNQASPVAIYLPISSRPATTVGVRLSSPLDFSTLDKSKQGWAAEAASSELTFKRKAFEEQRDWDDLATKFAQAQNRLKLYVDLEKMQREKLYYERERQQRGRSTLEQVLIYETDYESAESGRIRTLAELLNLNAKMKFYGVSYESR